MFVVSILAKGSLLGVGKTEGESRAKKLPAGCNTLATLIEERKEVTEDEALVKGSACLMVWPISETCPDNLAIREEGLEGFKKLMAEDKG